MKTAVIQFPGSNCDLDTIHVLRNVVNVEADLIWHKDLLNISDYDAFFLPGGFSYGDSLRAGIIAAYSPIMQKVKDAAKEGIPIIGICNGFQILVESELLPGALLENDNLKFICSWIFLKNQSNRTPFTINMAEDQIIHIPIAHGEGRYFIDSESLKELYENDQIIFKYSSRDGDLDKKYNPNGSLDNIAGICNLEGNVLGLMPHPERASERILDPVGRNDGKIFFESLINFIKKKRL
ncbi:MAG: phosphoribosylformylglycinamidine synthase I [Candidatus Lokiarchaeota archaeon]|nr:phosphoribosylformylglycinamidine synthase I [Candidatus Lokiarchaeota archaeon]